MLARCTPLVAILLAVGLAFATLSGLGCAHPQAATNPAPAAPAPTAAATPEAPAAFDPACASSFEPGLDPASDLARLAAACAAPAGLKAVTPVKVGGAQGQGDDAERFVFRGRADRCYRVLAVGSPEVTDLDIAIVDAEGRLAAADISSDRFPTAPPSGFFCLGADQVFTIQIGVRAGSGGYVAQVWGQ